MTHGSHKAAAESAAELSIRPESGEVRRAALWLQATGSELGVPAAEIGRLDHCLDEALANILSHGGPGARSAPIVLRLDVRRDADTCHAAVTVSDAGLAFDPLAYQPKPRPTTLADTEPGGLGLLLMRSFADKLSYRCGDGRNHLTFAVCWRDGCQ